MGCILFILIEVKWDGPPNGDGTISQAGNLVLSEAGGNIQKTSGIHHSSPSAVLTSPQGLNLSSVSCFCWGHFIISTGKELRYPCFPRLGKSSAAVP